jgi:hypothetical protein
MWLKSVLKLLLLVSIIWTHRRGFPFSVYVPCVDSSGEVMEPNIFGDRIFEIPSCPLCRIGPNEIPTPSFLIMDTPKSIDIKDVPSHVGGNPTNKPRLGRLRLCPHQWAYFIQ